MTDDQVRSDAVNDETQVTEPVAAPVPAEPAVPAEPIAPVSATPASAAAAPVAAAATTPGKPKRAAGGIGQAVGVIGLVLSLLLAVGTVAGTMWLTGQITEVGVSIDARIGQAQPALDTLSTKVGDVKSVVDELATAATAVSQSAAPSGPIVTTLRDKLDGLANRYATLRNAYGELRTNVTSAINSVQTLSRFIPGFTVPQGPIDALNNLDAKITEFDGTISDILSTDFSGDKLQAAATVVAEKVTKVSSALSAVVGVIQVAGEKITQAQTDIKAGLAQLTTYITIGGIVLALIFLYMALLHWVLFRTSRAVGRGA